MALRWYVIQAYSNFENKVKEVLKEHIEREGLQKHFGEILVPTEKVVEMRRGQQRTSDRKFFPGYVLMQMELTDKTWHLVKNVPKVLKFIGGTSEKPAPLSDKEAKLMLSQVEEGDNNTKPKVLFEINEVVRVIDGPFKDFNGNIKAVNYERNKLKISVLIFGRPASVELEFAQIEKT